MKAKMYFKLSVLINFVVFYSPELQTFLLHDLTDKVGKFSLKNHIMTITVLTLLHSERPKLFGVLVILSAVGLMCLDTYPLIIHHFYGTNLEE